MKNKNTIIFLLIVFAGICAYNLYWTYVQFQLDKKIEYYNSVQSDICSKADSTMTEEDRLLCNEAREFSNPDQGNITRYNKAVDNSFTLGLDLQGGMFVTLEVSISDLLNQMAGNSRYDADFKAALADATKKSQTEERPYVDLFVESMDAIKPGTNYGALFNNRAKGITPSADREVVLGILRDEANDAIDRTYEIIRQRIDQFGVVSPNLQKQEISGRILLELPGVKEPERVRKLLRSTARLEFWETYTIVDVFDPVLVQINDAMKIVEGIESENDSTATSPDTTGGNVVAELDSNGNPIDTNALADADTSGQDTSGLTSLEDLQDSAGVDDAVTDADREKFRRENPLFRHLSPPSQQIAQNSPLAGYATINDTSAVNKILAREDMQALIPEDMKFAWTFHPLEGTDNIYQLIALRKSARDSAALDGSVISNARQDIDERGNPSVSMEMNQRGARDWANITAANIQKSVAITLDGKVYTFPTVQGEIRGGNSQITGNFSIKEAQDLATVLKAGQLPVGANIESEDVVGPTLGAANVKRGFQSFLIAFIVTLVFMVIYYNKAGLVANVALLANLIFILGCAAAFGIVLTLPGVAALVLTVGMAVDANVLIFERVREEQAKGKTLKASIKSGFANAFSSVMDANITTFLTGVVLYAFGVGPIRGFAVALMIGIITSLISALIITRLILDYYSNKGSESIAFGSSYTTGLFDKIKINMVNRRKTFYMISGSLMVVFLISIATIGFKTGVDFDGGRQFVVMFEDEAGNPIDLTDGQIQEFRTNLTESFDNIPPQIKTRSAANRIQITTSYLAAEIDVVEGEETATDVVQERLKSGLAKTVPANSFEIESSSMVGPTMASDIKRAALYAVIFSLLIIFMYILIRFRKWQYSAGAVAAIFHDVIFVLGIYSLLSVLDLPFNVEIDQALIAALLTIIGYSINDTVVVFDRIRENLGEMKSSLISDVYNVSIDQTISRTLITSVTTLLTALILFIFGGDVLRGFIFAILIGVIVGTYSSIFVASPISLDLINREAKKEKEAA